MVGDASGVADGGADGGGGDGIKINEFGVNVTEYAVDAGDGARVKGSDVWGTCWVGLESLGKSGKIVSTSRSTYTPAGRGMYTLVGRGIYVPGSRVHQGGGGSPPGARDLISYIYI